MVLRVKMILLMLVMSLVGYSQPLIYNNSQISYDGKLVLSVFNPLDYSPIAWYDSKDLSTITKDGSNYVSQWNDKSGNGYNLQQLTGANQSLYSATNGIVFDGTNDYLSKTFGVSYNQPTTIFIVYSITGPTADQQSIFDNNDGGVYRNQLYWDITNRNGIYAGSVLEYGKNIAFPTIIATAVLNTTTSAIYENNILKASGDVGNYGLDGICIGIRYDKTKFPFKGFIKAIIVYSSALTTEQITTVNNYLNLKYTIY